MFEKLTALGLSAVLLSGAAYAEDTALILSNTNYSSVRDLADTVGSQQLAQQLKQAGFQMATEQSGTTSEMVRATKLGVENLSLGDRFVVVLQGHFGTVGGTTYLTGSRIRGADAYTLPFSGISVNTILQKAAVHPGKAIVAMVNPSHSANLGNGIQEGLTTLEAPNGVTLVQGEGAKVAEFIAALIDGRDVTVAEAARTSGARVTGFVPHMPFGGDGGMASPPSGVTERDFWTVTQSIDTVDAYEQYLEEYPNGEFRRAARRAVEFLEDAPSRAAEEAEARLGLDRRERQEIQSNLTLLGYNTRGVDGVFGRGSRAAIANWQRAEGFEATGFVTRAQILRLREQAAVKQRELDRIAAQEAANTRENDRDYWWETGRGRTEQGLRDYLERYPNGEYSDVARERLSAIEPAQPQVSQAQINQDRSQESRLAGNPITRLLVEKGLANKGLNPGRVDGRFDGNTRTAIKAFQANNNIPQTGYVGQSTAVRLLNSQ